MEISLDEDWVGTLSRLGRVVFALHRLASAPPHDFQRLAFDALSAEVPFDSGIWAAGVMAPNVEVHSFYAHNQPPEMIEAWLAVAERDSLLAETLRNPGVTLRGTANGPEGCDPFPAEVAAHAHRYGMEHVLGTSYIEPTLRLIEGFAFYRADPRARFSETDRLLVQHALPHLVEAWRVNRLNLVCRDKPASPRYAYGLCDRKGLLRTAGPDFSAMMRKEWSDWTGPVVPGEWLGQSRKVVSRAIVAATEPVGDFFLVRIRQRAPLDSLTSREADVAVRFGQGLNYQEIATELHIAPTTVRNHLTNIYGKLGVANKVELAKLFD